MHPSPISLFLPATGTWPQSYYWLDGKAQDAIHLAAACGRPLLVRGFPGTGKSDLARAAAELLQRAFVYEVVTARTEPQDLLWRFDAIARLADAQALASMPAARKLKHRKAADPGNAKHYISPGVLWWAINWQSAEQQLTATRHAHTQRPDGRLQRQGHPDINQQHRAEQNGCVLLLDEIDKADAELPNSLLEVLANTGFNLPWHAKVTANAHRPVIVITTNEDRELPAAFVRRCLVLKLEPDKDFKQWLTDRARVHFRQPEIHETPETSEAPKDRPILSNAILDRAAQELIKDRQNHSGDGSPPGLAEYLDLLYGLSELAPNDEVQQQDWLNRVYQFAYQKQAPGR